MAESAQPAPVAEASIGLRAACLRLYDSTHADRYGISADEFVLILLEVVRKYQPSRTEQEALDFLRTLRCEELALARACALGNETAWQEFLTCYRASLYTAAFSITKDEATGRELADSLYADLYGFPKPDGQRNSKLRYYMGRGSLEGWLRTVLAQEYVNRYRRTKNEASLDEKVEAGAQFAASESPVQTREPKLDSAVTASLSSLSSEDRFILSAYYLDKRTLAEIAKILRVHESTISRKLERLVSDLRKRIRKQLIAEGMNSRQADEIMQDSDVRDLDVNVRQTLQQETRPGPFYKERKQKGTSQ